MAHPDALTIVRSCYEAFQRGDVASVLAMIADPVDWRFVGPTELPFARVTHTKEGAQQFFMSLAEADEVELFEPREFIDGGDHVTVLGMYRAKSKPKGVRFETEFAHIFTVRDGKVVRWAGFYDTASSVAAR